MSTNDKINVQINGHTHSTWQQYSIDSDMLTMADDWQMMASFDPSDPRGAVLPDFVYEGASVQITLGDDLILNGIIDDVDDVAEKTARYFELYGRDKGSLLLDCSVPLLSLQQATLDQIIKQAVQPLGITDISYQAKPSAPRQKMHTEPGQPVWEWLKAACEASQVWPWFAPDGTLIIGTPDYTTPPVSDLIMRSNGAGNNILSLRRTRSIHASYSQVTVLGQSGGTGDVGQNDIEAVANDPTMPLYRPKVVIDGNCETDDLAQRRANKIMADGRMQRDKLVIVAPGHRIKNGSGTGDPWKPGVRVNVVSEPHNINAIYYVTKRKFNLSRNQISTELHCIPDGTWLLDLGFVKAARKSNFGKKKGYYAGSNSAASSDGDSQ